MGLDAYFLCLELSRGIPPLYPRSSLQPFTKGWAGNATQTHPWLNTSAPATGLWWGAGGDGLGLFCLSEGHKENKENAVFRISSFHQKYFFGVSKLQLYITVSRREKVKTIKEHKQNADRTEKEIFGIFGIINTIKITNGKSQ